MSLYWDKELGNTTRKGNRKWQMTTWKTMLAWCHRELGIFEVVWSDQLYRIGQTGQAEPGNGDEVVIGVSDKASN